MSFIAKMTFWEKLSFLKKPSILKAFEGLVVTLVSSIFEDKREIVGFCRITETGTLAIPAFLKRVEKVMADMESKPKLKKDDWP